ECPRSPPNTMPAQSSCSANWEVSPQGVHPPEKFQKCSAKFFGKEQVSPGQNIFDSIFSGFKNIFPGEFSNILTAWGNSVRIYFGMGKSSAGIYSGVGKSRCGDRSAAKKWGCWNV